MSALLVVVVDVRPEHEDDLHLVDRSVRAEVDAD
jgi:hypothetical protein